MAITRAQQARQMLQDGNQVIGPLGEDDLQSGFVSGAKRLLTPGNIGRAAAFLLSGGATSAAEVAKEIAKQKALNEIMDKTGDVVGPKIETKLMKMENDKDLLEVKQCLQERALEEVGEILLVDQEIFKEVENNLILPLNP